MKNLTYLLIMTLLTIVSSCSGKEEEPVLSNIYPEFSQWTALYNISHIYRTETPEYPSPWNWQDPSTWANSINVDTVINPKYDEPCLVVTSLKLYIIDSNIYNLTDIFDLKDLKDLQLYSCPNAWINYRHIPYGCESVLLEKIDSGDGGRIFIGDPWSSNYKNNFWIMKDEMEKHDWKYRKLIIHGTDLHGIYCCFEDSAEVDLSDNCIEQPVYPEFAYFKSRINLSRNNISDMGRSWEEWISSDQTTIPNLQYNDIQIPEWVLTTSWWRKNHEWFIGNPGYVAP